MVAPVRAAAADNHIPGRTAAAGELIPLPARRYVLRVQVDGAEYVFDATAKLPAAQASVLSTIRGYNAPRQSGGAAMLALEGALRTAARLTMPMLVRLVSSLRATPMGSLLMPPLPPLPKHHDALEHLACWLVEAVFQALGTGAYTLEPDEDAAYLDRERDLIVLPVRRLRWLPPGTVEAKRTPGAQDAQQSAQEVREDG